MIMSETLKSNPELEEGYQAMANDEDREAEALEWAEATVGDVAEEPECNLVFFKLTRWPSSSDD
jgi:hypothetical protein